MDHIGIIISASITIFSIGLLILALSSYKKYGNTKLLVISIVFIVFLTKGMLFSISIFYPDFSTFDFLLCGVYSGIFDLIILVLLFLSTFKR